MIPLRWLMRNSGNIDIHMIPADESARPRREPIEERLARAPWRDFGVALVIAAVVTALSLSIFDYTGYWAVSLFYLLAVVLAATRLTPLADAFSRRAQCVALGFSLHSSAPHFLHHPLPRLLDVRRLFRDRTRHRSPGDKIARARTIGAPPRRTRHRALSFHTLARGQPRSR